MSVGALLAELNQHGIEIESDGDRLRYAGPQEAISPELIGRLKAYKADLIAVCGKTGPSAGEDRDFAETAYTRPTSDPEVCKLFDAGWASKERRGKLIWKHPDKGFYYSQGMAAHFLDRGIGNARCKSGTNGKG